MGNIIVGAIVVLIIFLAARKIYNDKKSGVTCSACGGGGCGGCQSAPARPKRKPGQVAAVKEYSVEGMTCEHCQRAVENALASVDGVLYAEVNLKKNTARVELNSEAAAADALTATNDALSKAVTDAGYKLQPAG